MDKYLLYHKRRSTLTPEALDCLIGTLLVGHPGTLGSTQGCNQQLCRARLWLNYMFAQWFQTRRVSFLGTIMHACGPMAALRIQHKVPANAELFTSEKLGNIEGLAELFKSRQESTTTCNFSHKASSVW